jgi:hypothetical protein
MSNRIQSDKSGYDDHPSDRLIEKPHFFDYSKVTVIDPFFLEIAGNQEKTKGKDKVDRKDD